MSPAAVRRLLYAVLVLLFVLHGSWWLRGDPSFALGLPVALAYHLIFCIAVAGVMALLLRFGGSTEVDDDGKGS